MPLLARLRSADRSLFMVASLFGGRPGPRFGVIALPNAPPGRNQDKPRLITPMKSTYHQIVSIDKNYETGLTRVLDVSKNKIVKFNNEQILGLVSQNLGIHFT